MWVGSSVSRANAPIVNVVTILEYSAADLFGAGRSGPVVSLGPPQLQPPLMKGASTIRARSSLRGTLIGYRILVVCNLYCPFVIRVLKVPGWKKRPSCRRITGFDGAREAHVVVLTRNYVRRSLKPA